MITCEMGLQLFIGYETPIAEKIDPVVNRKDWMKPKGGFWTSSWDAEEKISEWVEWCRSETFGDLSSQSWWMLTPRRDCRMYTIDSYADLVRCLHGNYGYPCTYLEDMRRHMGESYDRRFIDFERMAQHYDGVHLTSRGREETHVSYPYDLYGWDVESTLWFRWCFSEVEKVQL